MSFEELERVSNRWASGSMAYAVFDLLIDLKYAKTFMAGQPLPMVKAKIKTLKNKIKKIKNRLPRWEENYLATMLKEYPELETELHNCYKS